MKTNDVEGLRLQAEDLYDTLHQAICTSIVDVGHGGMLEVATVALGNDERVTEYEQILAKLDGLEDDDGQGYEEAKTKAMVLAQLDLVAAIRYRLGFTNEFSWHAALESAQELSLFTGEPLPQDMRDLQGN